MPDTPCLGAGTHAFAGRFGGRWRKLVTQANEGRTTRLARGPTNVRPMVRGTGGRVARKAPAPRRSDRGVSMGGGGSPRNLQSRSRYRDAKELPDGG